jgi:hypothetical protein
MPANPEVEAFLADLAHPLQDAIEAVRAAILAASPEIDEAIKWKSPTFMYRGNMASLDPRSKQHVLLLFHTGARSADPGGLIEGDGAMARYVRFADLADVRRKRRALTAVVCEWVRMQDAAAAATARRRTAR